MAASVSIVKRTVHGDQRVVTADVTFDSTYPSGGESITPSQLGLTTITHVGLSVSTNGYVVQYLPSTSKAKVWYGDNNNASDGPLIENATTDLSAETARLRFEGK